MVYILNQFKDKFTETVDEIKDKERKWFDNMMDNFVKNPLQPDVYGFLTFIAGKEMAPHINSLKNKATKKKPFTFDRLCFVIIPVFKYIEHLKSEGNKGEMDKILQTIDEWCSIVTN